MFIAISLVANGKATTKWKRFIYRRNNQQKQLVNSHKLFGSSTFLGWMKNVQSWWRIPAISTSCGCICRQKSLVCFMYRVASLLSKIVLLVCRTMPNPWTLLQKQETFSTCHIEKQLFSYPDTRIKGKNTKTLFRAFEKIQVVLMPTY